MNGTGVAKHVHVICFDGTNNQFGPENTNVVRLVQVLDRDPARQRLYYDPGVGTLPEPNAWSWSSKKLSELYGLAFGAGLEWKVGEAYSYLMDHWEPGDPVFLFGFSRGAYTARVLAGLLHALGLLPRGNQNLLPFVLRLYNAVRKEQTHEETSGNSSYWDLCREFRWSFARQVSSGDDGRRFRVHFLGLWDTVSSVGWVWDPVRYPYTAHNPSIDVIRHAISVDERRWFFRQNLMGQTGGQDLQEHWFAGVHADVGGGYPEDEGGLWRNSFQWILGEAERAGLLVNPERLHTILHKTPPPDRPWTERQHESLTPMWWPAEFVPKWHVEQGLPIPIPRIGLGRHRTIAEGALIHKSTLLRIRETNYTPPNFPPTFLDKIRALPDVPEALPFEPSVLLPS